MSNLNTDFGRWTLDLGLNNLKQLLTISPHVAGGHIELALDVFFAHL